MQHTVIVGTKQETKNWIRATIHRFDGQELSFRGALKDLLPNASAIDDWKTAKSSLLARGNSKDVLILAEEESFWSRQDFQLLIELAKRGQAAGVYLLARFSERNLIPDEVLVNAEIIEFATVT